MLVDAGCHHFNFSTWQIKPRAICQLSSEDLDRNKWSDVSTTQHWLQEESFQNQELQCCRPHQSNYKWSLHLLLSSTICVNVGCTKFTKGKHIDHNWTQCQPQPLSLPPPLNITLTIQWPGAHTNIPIVTLFTLEKRMGTWYSYSLIINRSLRTVGNRWKNKMLWTLNLALTCEQEQALRSWASCQGGLDTSCRCFDLLTWLLAWFFIVKTRPTCWSQPHQLYHYPWKETVKHCPHISRTGCLWNQGWLAGVFKAPDSWGLGKQTFMALMPQWPTHMWPWPPFCEFLMLWSWQKCFSCCVTLKTQQVKVKKGPWHQT